MGAPLNDGKKLRHRDRKNPRSAELWCERKRSLNAARPKQLLVTEIAVDGTKKFFGPTRVPASYGEAA
jgi:hypothetical protein